MTIKTYIINSMQNTIVDIIEYEPVVHEFTESGTYYKSPNVNSISVISVGGGGAGGGSSHLIYGGEGGYAGEISYNYYTDIDDSLNIIIGDGGLGAPDTIGASGGNTSVGDLQTSIGGNGGVKRYIAYEIGGDGEDGYGNVQLATDGSAYSTSGNVAPGIGGVGYGAGGGGSGCRIFFTNYSGGNGAPGYVKITEYIPIEYKITEPGIYHIVAVDDSNNLLRAFTAPGLKIVDERRGTILTSEEFERPTDDTLNTVSGFVYYNGEAAANCKVFCVRNDEIYDVVYSDGVGEYEIYAKAPDIIVAESTNNTTERPKVVI
jgi:hypothetical protein